MLRDLWAKITGREPTASPESTSAEQDPFESMLQRMERSEQGRELTSHVRALQEEHRVTLQFTSNEKSNLNLKGAEYEGLTHTEHRPTLLGANAELGPEPNRTTITLNHKHRNDEDRQFLAFVHETSHCQQDWNPLPFPKTREESLTRGFVEEAKAEAHTCRVAHELYQQGDTGPWERFQSNAETSDIAQAYLEGLRESPEQAMRAAQEQWIHSPERQDAYRDQFLAEKPHMNQQTQDDQSSKATSLTEEQQVDFDERTRSLTLPESLQQEQSKEHSPSQLDQRRRITPER